MLGRQGAALGGLHEGTIPHCLVELDLPRPEEPLLGPQSRGAASSHADTSPKPFLVQGGVCVGVVGVLHETRFHPWEVPKTESATVRVVGQVGAYNARSQRLQVLWHRGTEAVA